MSQQQRQSTAVTRLTPEAVATLDSVMAPCCGIDFQTERGLFARAFKVSGAIQQLRESITPDVMGYIMSLQCSSLGFRTDKDASNGYPVDVVRDCFIEATLRGAYPVDNEFNIIAGRCYLALNFFRRKLKELPGLTDLKLSAEVPALANGGALVAYRATWIYNGVPDRLERIAWKHENGAVIDERIPIRVNSGMIVDAILGKAERKMRAMILARITGTEHTDSEGEESGMPPSLPPVGRASLRSGQAQDNQLNGPTTNGPASEAKQAENATGQNRDVEPAASTKPDPDYIADDFSQRITAAQDLQTIELIVKEVQVARPVIGEKYFMALAQQSDTRHAFLSKLQTQSTTNGNQGGTAKSANTRGNRNF